MPQREKNSQLYSSICDLVNVYLPSQHNETFQLQINWTVILLMFAMDLFLKGFYLLSYWITPGAQMHITVINLLAVAVILWWDYFSIIRSHLLYQKGFLSPWKCVSAVASALHKGRAIESRRGNPISWAHLLSRWQ